MSETTWKRLIRVFGLIGGGVLMWKTVKYFFGATVLFWVVAIIVTVKIVSNTYLGAMEMQHRHSLEKTRVQLELENKDKIAEREHSEKLQEIAFQQQRVADMQKYKESLTRREAYEEIERKLIVYNNTVLKDWKELQMQHQFLSEMYVKEGNPDAHLRMFELEHKMERERPDYMTIEKGREEVKRNVLVAYGLMQDPLIQAVVKETPQPIFPEIIVPQVEHYSISKFLPYTQADVDRNNEAYRKSIIELRNIPQQKSWYPTTSATIRPSRFRR